MTLRAREGQLVDSGAVHEFLAEVLLPKKQDDAREIIRSHFERQDRQMELLKAAGLLDWLEGKGEKKEAVCDWIGYGGAAFGGKTFGQLILFLVAAYAYPGIQMGLFRRTYKELTGAGSAEHDARRLFEGIATFREGGLAIHFGETGSSLFLCHCENENDVYTYQSKQFDIIGIDEATHFSWFQVEFLKTRNRVSGDNGIKRPFMVLSSNPGNIGHGWYMQMFQLEQINKWIRREWSEPQKVINPSNQASNVYFIPSFISDNKIGVERDPKYEERLRESNPDLAEAMIAGDWHVFSGMAFRNFEKDVHVIKQADLPKDFRNFPKWRGVDWGYDAPFCCLWFAKDPNIGRIYVYREVYAAGLTDAQQAAQIVLSTPPDEAISITYGDPISFSVRHTRKELVFTSADEYRENGVFIYNADNDRVNGKRKIDQLLAPLPDGKPGLIITDNCINLIRTLPKLARSETNAEDVALKQEDHAYSALRYGLTNPGMHSKKNDKQQNNQPNPWNKIPGL